jgi:WD40 repeat protein/serine/threonine protein kinase
LTLFGGGPLARRKPHSNRLPAMIHCPFCGLAVSSTAQRAGICPSCGESLSANQPPAGPPVQPSAKTVDLASGTVTWEQQPVAGADTLDLPPAQAGQPVEPPVREAGGSTVDLPPPAHLVPPAPAGSETVDLGAPVVPPQKPATISDVEKRRTVDVAPVEEAPPKKPVTIPNIGPGQTVELPPADDPAKAPFKAGTVLLGPQNRTIDLTGVDTPAGGKPPTVDDLRTDRTIDLPGLSPEMAARMTGLWGEVLRSDDDRPHVTIKGATKGAGGKSTLVILPRAVRSHLESGKADDVPVREGQAEYELLDVLGEGGMGVVYAARQASIDRTVAIKMVKPNVAADNEQRRKFLAEAVVTGELEHPNIVPIYDLGANETGALFYAMKRVQGTPWMKKLPTCSAAENVEILMKVADAVAFAHSRGVVHRDLKPENVMLGDFGEVLVMDWGLAIGTDQFRKHHNVGRTVSMGGTPAYMAPEMAAGPIEAIGPASDIYLLGAILYEIVTGNPPHAGRTTVRCLLAATNNEIQATNKTGELVEIARKAMATEPADRYPSVPEFQAAIRNYQSHAESVLLSARAEDDLSAAQQSLDYQTFARSVFGFEQALALWAGNSKAAATLKTAKGAYATSALAKGDFDLGLSLLDADDEGYADLRAQILAARAERDARQQRLKAAKRVGVAMAAAIFLIVTGAAVWINRERGIAQANEREAVKQKGIAEVERDRADEQRGIAVRERDRADGLRVEAENNANAAIAARADAEEQRDNARIAEGKAVQAQVEAEDARNDAVEARDIAVAAREAEEYQAYIARIGLAKAKIDENSFDVAAQLLDECPEELRNWEWGRLQFLCRQYRLTAPAGANVDAVAFAPDGERFVAGSWDGKARVWHAPSDRILKEIDVGGQYVQAVAFSPDGSQVAVGSSDPEGYLKLFDASTGQPMQTFRGHEQAVVSVAFSPDGSKLLSAGYDRTARLWDVATGEELQVIRGHNWWVWQAVFSADEQSIITASHDGTAAIWPVAGELPREVPLFTGHGGPVFCVAASPSGDLVATGGYDKRILLWDPAALKPFDFDSFLEGKPAQLPPHRQLVGHTGPVRCLRFSQDGRLLVSGGEDNNVIVWDVATGRLLKTLRGHSGLIRSCDLTADGQTVLTGSYDSTAKVWSIAGYQEVRSLLDQLQTGHRDEVLSVGFSAAGDRLVTTSRDRSARVLDLAHGSVLATLREGHEFLASSVTFFPEGTRLLTSGVDDSVRAWDVATGTQLFELHGTGRGAVLALSRDGRTIATGGEGDTARLWSAEDGTLLHTLEGHAGEITAAAFSPDGALLLTGDVGGRAWLWDVAGGSLLARLDAHTRRVVAVGFAADGAQVLTASSDYTVARWDVARRATLPALVLKHPKAVTAMAVSSDGRWAVTACDDDVERVWDLTTATEVGTLNEPGQVEALAISADGRLALTACYQQRTVRIWDLATRRELPPLPGRSAGAALLAFEEGGGIVESAAFSPDAARVVTVGGTGARLWNVASGEQEQEFRPQGIVAGAGFSPDGQHLVTADWENLARIWSTSTWQPERKLVGGHTDSVTTAVYSPDGQRVLTASYDGTAIVWDAATGEVLLKLPAVTTAAGRPARLRSAAYSTDGTRIVTACQDNQDRSARIYDAATGELLQTLSGHRWGVLAAVFSQDGKYVFTGSEDNTARLWDVATGQALRTFEGHTAPITSVAMSPDGKRALTGSRDHSVKLWDTGLGQPADESVAEGELPRAKEILTLGEHSEDVTSVAFAPDGRAALTGSRDGTASLWMTADWQASDSQPADDAPETAGDGN